MSVYVSTQLHVVPSVIVDGLFLKWVIVLRFFLFRAAWRPSAGKELSSWLSACAVLLYAVLIVCIPDCVRAGCEIRLYRFLIIAMI